MMYICVCNVLNLTQDNITEGHPDYTPEKITPGLVCTTKFSADNAWYRAEVTDVEGDKVTVKFVDYGNRCVAMHVFCKSFCVC